MIRIKKHRLIYVKHIIFYFLGKYIFHVNIAIDSFDFITNRFHLMFNKKLSFSQRYGYAKYVKIGQWAVSLVLKKNMN